MESSSLTGAWELVSDTHEGLLFIAGNNWGEITVEKDRRQFAWDKMTEQRRAVGLSNARSGRRPVRPLGRDGDRGRHGREVPRDGRDDRQSRLRRRPGPH